MRSLSSLFLTLSLAFLPFLAGCGGGVDTTPAPLDEATIDEDSTSGLSEAEQAEFEAGEGGEDGDDGEE